MGKKHKHNKKHQLNQLLKPDNLPLVSLCTPTFNRRPFIKQCIKNMLNQTYPLDKLEWVVIDDGFDKVGDLFNEVTDIKIKYLPFDEKMSLGKKRNMLHKESSGDILIYIDDDDYYTPDRVLHAVTELLKSKKLIAGSSELYIWFQNEAIHKFGPYGLNHATAGTFAFKKELLNMSSFVDDACFAEEKKFLHNYSIPLIQLNPNKVMLVFNHFHNTIDKKQFIVGNNKFVKKTDLETTHFIKDKDALQFYTHTIHELLKDYDPGLSKHKPDLIDSLNKLKIPYRNLTNDESDKLTSSNANVNTQNLLNNKTNNNDKNNDKDNDITVRHIDGNGVETLLNKRNLVDIINQLKERDAQLIETIDIQHKKLSEMSDTIEELKEEYRENNETNQHIENIQTNDNVFYENDKGEKISLTKHNLVNIIQQYQETISKQNDKIIQQQRKTIELHSDIDKLKGKITAIHETLNS